MEKAFLKLKKSKFYIDNEIYKKLGNKFKMLLIKEAN